MRCCKQFFVVVSVLAVSGLLFGNSLTVFGAEQGKATANQPAKGAPEKKVTTSCTYGGALDSSDEVVYVPIGSDCGPLLKDFTAQAKSCCVCKKEEGVSMACRGDCCPIMFSKVGMRRNASAKITLPKAAPAKRADAALPKAAVAAAPAKAVPAKPAATGRAPAKPAAGVCKYTISMDSAGQMVYVPTGGGCEQLLKTLAAQKKDCCVGGKDGADMMVYKGTCCPVMFQPTAKK